MTTSLCTCKQFTIYAKDATSAVSKAHVIRSFFFLFVTSVLESSCRINTGKDCMFKSLCAENIYLNSIEYYIMPALNYRVGESCTYVCSLGSFLEC